MKVGRLAVVIAGSALGVAGEDAADAHVAAFCVMHADSPHCTDFDSENPVSYGYQAMVGIVSRDEGRSVSPPAADDSGAATTNENIQLLAFPAGGRFNAVELLLTTTPNGVRAVVRIQQVSALDHVFRCPKLSTAPTLRVGLIAAGGAPAQEGTAYFDNVLFAAK